MDTISVKEFRDNLKRVAEQVINDHNPIKVTRRAGEAFVVMSVDGRLVLRNEAQRLFGLHSFQ